MSTLITRERSRSMPPAAAAPSAAGVRAPTLPAPAASTASTASTPRPIRILIVDDTEPLRDLLGRALRLEGWDVREAADGASALALAAEFRPDAIVLDLMLPDMSGVRVVSALRKAADLTPVLFLTARDDTSDRIDAYMAGGDDYLTKPFSLEDVAAHVLALVEAASAAGPPGSADLVDD